MSLGVERVDLGRVVTLALGAGDGRAGADGAAAGG